MWLFLAFIFVPLIEIALFVQVGGLIGLWWTLATVVGTAILGTILVRGQGLHVLSQIRGSFEEMNDPTEPLAHGAMILFSGALLLTPGFFTDAVGFSLLVPSIRKSLFRFIKARIKIQSVQYGRGGVHRASGDTSTIEGEYHEVDIDAPPTNRSPSGWTRH